MKSPYPNDFHLSSHLLDGEIADYYQAIIDGLRSFGLQTDTQSGLGGHRGVRLQTLLAIT
jgi:hypothetical protein